MSIESIVNWSRQTPRARVIACSLITCSAIFATHFPLGPDAHPCHAAASDAVVADADGEPQFVERPVVESATLRATLLETVREDAVSDLFHWYSSQIKVDGRWLSLEEVQQRASEDARLPAYRRRRDQTLDSAADHERIARWCAGQGLADLANMHWLHVIRWEPEHRAALKELGLRWLDGLLLSEKEADGYQERKRVFEKERKKWQVKIKRMRRDLE